MDNCLFCKIVRGEIPSKKIYEDDDVLAFHDIQPVAAVHFMLIPKRHVDSLASVDESHQQVLGKIMALTGKLAREQGSPEGFRTIINTGRIARQDVAHLHVHVLGGADVLPRMLVMHKE
ncbi:MAG: histidine triad nucleotide-binding protein [Burkholderiales bacterium]|nr:histidine triad nucleotide-binding protein [Burkholderiales bacterium]MDQ3195397.1 histidine triad nucleotide-binding protein [Pseudomonadota bacterium]